MFHFSDTFGDECEECLQNKITAEKNKASRDDNSRGDLNTAVDEEQTTDCNPIKPTQALGRDSVDGGEQSIYRLLLYKLFLYRLLLLFLYGLLIIIILYHWKSHPLLHTIKLLYRNNHHIYKHMLN